MKLFLKRLKVRFWRKYTLFAVLVAVFLIGLTYFVHAYDDIQYYFSVNGGSLSSLIVAEEEPVISPEVIERSNTYTRTMEQANVFSFQAAMHHAVYSYYFLGPILLTLPVLAFYYERKGGYFRLLSLRAGDYHGFLLKEGLACAISGWLIALIPWLIVWLLLVLLCPMPTYLFQAPSVSPNAVFGSFFREDFVAWAYLLQILSVSPLYFFYGFLLFAISLLLNRGVYLIFIPLLYNFIVPIVLRGLSLWRYAPDVPLEHISETITFANLMVPWLYTFLLAVLILLVFVRKERAVNG